MSFVRVTVAAMGVEQKTQSPVVYLRTEDGDRELPIFIGPMEANAIAMVLEDVPFPRPMTHDLFVNVLHRLGAAVVRVEVVDLREHTFFARLCLMLGDEEIEIDARPSDAIALALRDKAPIWVDEDVLRKAALSDTERKQREKERWKTFLENLDDDDFGRYPS